MMKVDAWPHTQKTKKSRQSKPPRIIEVSIRTKHRSHKNNKVCHSIQRRKKSNNITPIITSSFNDTHSTENKQHEMEESGKTQSTMTRKQHSASVVNIQWPLQSSSPQVSVNRKHQQEKNIGSDQKGMTNNYHRSLKQKKKKICSKKCIIISVLIVLLVIIITMGISVGLVMKSKSETTTSNVIPTLRWNKTGITIAGLSGIPGNASNQLYQPRDVVLVYPDLLYVADYENHRVQKYVIGSTNGATTVAGQANALGGVLPSQLEHPARILVDSSGGIYVSDTDNHRVQYWSNGATNGTTVAGDPAGTHSSANNRLYLPYGLAYDSTSNALYISDYGNFRVMRYPSGVLSGTLAAGNRTAGTGITQIYSPVGLYFDSSSNSLVIANHVAHNIVRWVLNATSWQLLAGNMNGTLGNSSTEFRYPTEMAFDPMGNMYVSDRDNHRIQLFMNNQLEGITIVGVTGVPGTDASLLRTPWSVKLDNQLNLYVADSNNHRIQKFLRY